MAWELRNQEINEPLGMHVMHLHNTDTGAKHKLQINLLTGSCPHCGSHRKQTLTEMDPLAILKAELLALNAKHELMQKYKAKHRLVSAPR
jgi:hypothetical protein